jgi:hypothetical protein
VIPLPPEIYHEQPRLVSRAKLPRTGRNNFFKLLSTHWDLVGPPGFEPGTNGPPALRQKLHFASHYINVPRPDPSAILNKLPRLLGDPIRGL